MPRTQLIQHLSTEINLTILPPDDDEEADAVELPIPSQFLTTFKDGSSQTTGPARRSRP